MIFRWIQLCNGEWVVGEEVADNHYWICGSTVLELPMLLGGIVRRPLPQRDKILRIPEVESWHHCIENPVVVKANKPNDCPVVAVANLLNWKYSRARLIAFHNGWSSTSGLAKNWALKILEDNGMEIRDREDLCGQHTSEFHVDDGCYTVHIKNHIMPCVNGELLNISEGHIETVKEIRLCIEK